MIIGLTDEVTSTINKTAAGDTSNPPSHYDSKVQPIHLIESAEEAGMGIGYREGSIIAYVYRWKKKNGLRDLYAAQWLLNRLVSQEEQRLGIS